MTTFTEKVEGLLQRTEDKNGTLMARVYFPESEEFGWTPLAQLLAEAHQAEISRMLESLPEEKEYAYKADEEIAFTDIDTATGRKAKYMKPKDAYEPLGKEN